MKNNRKRAVEKLSRWFLDYPARISILGFLGLIFIGAFLLMLPGAVNGPGIGFIDALFTATSAACVTGLAVVDTGTVFTPLGQGMLLALIQVGGLGIMTISTLFLLIAGKRPGFKGRIVIQDTFTHQKEQGPGGIIRDVMIFCFSIEALGAVLMFACFYPDHGPAASVWLSVFHAVSAFCNAGFSLFSDSLTGYQADWFLNIVLCFLIITGGIGFLVLSEIRRHLFQRGPFWRRLSLHSKLVIVTSAVLLAGGTILILVMEWGNTMAHLSAPDRFLTAFFQSVTTRTAGFNSLPIQAMASETLFLIIVLMFIGASPGSCGGGMKTTTFATVLLLGFSRFRGWKTPRIFCRSIPAASIAKAVNVILLGTIVVVAATLLLLMTELGGVSHMESRGKFLELFFEVVSAVGTAGLSAGVTGGLSAAGKLIITVLMFVGRLGPLAVGVAISRGRDTLYQFAEEDIMIG